MPALPSLPVLHCWTLHPKSCRRWPGGPLIPEALGVRVQQPTTDTGQMLQASAPHPSTKRLLPWAGHRQWGRIFHEYGRQLVSGVRSGTQIVSFSTWSPWSTELQGLRADKLCLLLLRWPIKTTKPETAPTAPCDASSTGSTGTVSSSSSAAAAAAAAATPTATTAAAAAAAASASAASGSPSAGGLSETAGQGSEEATALSLRPGWILQQTLTAPPLPQTLHQQYG